jgi:hypothetical protein
MPRASFQIASCSLLLLSSASLAQVHAGDILLNVSSGVISTRASLIEPAPGTRVFVRTVGTIAPDYADVGFDNLPGSFPAGSRNGFRILGSLKKWTGTNLAPASTVSLMISNFGTLTALTPSDESTLTGYTLAVSSNGQWHRHLDFDLLNASTGSPPDGVYVVQLQIFNNTGSLADTPPFFVVLNQNLTPDQPQAAADWIVNNLINPPPACIGDFDNSGGTPDSSDIDAFFNAWLAGEDSADVDGSGGTPDSSDIDTFFIAWLAGC